MDVSSSTNWWLHDAKTHVFTQDCAVGISVSNIESPSSSVVVSMNRQIIHFSGISPPVPSATKLKKLAANASLCCCRCLHCCCSDWGLIVCLVGCIVAARSIECGGESQIVSSKGQPASRGWRKASCIILQGIAALQIWGASFCGLEETQTKVVNRPRKIRVCGAKEATSYGCITLRGWSRGSNGVECSSMQNQGKFRPSNSEAAASATVQVCSRRKAANYGVTRSLRSRRGAMAMIDGKLRTALTVVNPSAPKVGLSLSLYFRSWENYWQWPLTLVQFVFERMLSL